MHTDGKSSCIMENRNVSRDQQLRHVAVFALPISSHAAVLFALVHRLATADPSVKFSFFGTLESNASLITETMPQNIQLCDVPNGVPEGYVVEGKPLALIGFFLKGAPENFRRRVRLAEEHVRRRVTCVVADAFLWFTSEIAVEMGVSWVPLWAAGTASLSIHVYTDFIRQTVGLNSNTHQILKFIPGFAEVRLGDLPDGVVSGDLESPFSIMLHKMGQVLPQATAIAINSFEELVPPIVTDLKTNKFRVLLNIGHLNPTSPAPLLNSDEHACVPWLEQCGPTSVVYIGFGTTATPPPDELKALAEALEEIGCSFLWSLKESLKCHLPQGFLQRTSNKGKVVPWVPQTRVLSHPSICVFVCHSGWNSLMESIAAGVPMVCRPFFGDHQLNTFMVEKVWQIGVRVEGDVFTKDATMSAIQSVLSHERGKIMKNRINMYKELAIKAAGPDGSATKNFKSLLELIAG